MQCFVLCHLPGKVLDTALVTWVEVTSRVTQATELDRNRKGGPGKFSKAQVAFSSLEDPYPMKVT